MTDFAADILDFRSRKDAYFRTGNSPLSADRRANFTGLAYYPPDPAYSFTLPVERLGEEVVEIGTTTGESRPFVRYGSVTVPFPEGNATLTLFTPVGEDVPTQVFVPFRDATAGSETYEAGRYLEGHLHDDLVTLDFNLAYAPYCAYGEGWSCPIPPRENWIGVPVRAGERDA